MTSARLTISTASDRWRALRFNSRLSGGAKTTLPKLMPTNIQHTHNESLTYCTRRPCAILAGANACSSTNRSVLLADFRRRESSKLFLEDLCQISSFVRVASYARSMMEPSSPGDRCPDELDLSVTASGKLDS